MKPKIMDYDKDWEYIKETHLAFLLEPKDGEDPAPVDPAADPRDALLRTLISSF